MAMQTQTKQNFATHILFVLIQSFQFAAQHTLSEFNVNIGEMHER